jgi:shikimate dehydrogenase
MLNKNTQVCISVSENPGNTGTTIHNALYAKHGLDFIYKSFKIKDFSGIPDAMRTLGIRGCSVAQPYKFEAARVVDVCNDAGSGVINTIVQDTTGKLVGWNTDVYGARRVIEKLGADKAKTVVVIGAGATARSVLWALTQLNYKNIVVSNRTQWKVAELGQKFIELDDITTLKDVGLIINATSLGTKKIFLKFYKIILDLHRKSSTKDDQFAVMDVVPNPARNGVKDLCTQSHIKYGSGKEMAIYQSLCQFELYTGIEFDIEEEKKFVENLLNAS